MVQTIARRPKGFTGDLIVTVSRPQPNAASHHQLLNRLKAISPHR
jgi:hypothetical protein